MLMPPYKSLFLHLKSIQMDTCFKEEYFLVWRTIRVLAIDDNLSGISRFLAFYNQLYRSYNWVSSTYGLLYDVVIRITNSSQSNKLRILSVSRTQIDRLIRNYFKSIQLVWLNPSRSSLWATFQIKSSTRHSRRRIQCLQWLKLAPLHQH